MYDRFLCNDIFWEVNDNALLFNDKVYPFNQMQTVKLKTTPDGNMVEFCFCDGKQFLLPYSKADSGKAVALVQYLNQNKLGKQVPTIKREEQKEGNEGSNNINLYVLKKSGAEGYWEYEVLSVIDERGVLDAEKLKERLNELGSQGWRLKTAYSNELGKNAVSVLGFGVNTTIDQNVLILERFVKF